ncbi:hypothetical protein AB0L10_42125 [Streptomyces flaveolus]|uniref:hypothetical protein n=1 Tax=Streptomyces flaveolus TaxID=67297 RepID=UPI0034175A44
MVWLIAGAGVATSTAHRLLVQYGLPALAVTGRASRRVLRNDLFGTVMREESAARIMSPDSYAGSTESDFPPARR